jgi:hypothetical protein
MASSPLQLLVGFTYGWMQYSDWLRSVVAEAPHGINATRAACEGNHSWTMMP